MRDECTCTILYIRKRGGVVCISCVYMYNIYGACVFGHVVRVCTYLRSIVWWCMNNVCGGA